MNVKSQIYFLASTIVIAGLSIATLAFWQTRDEGDKYSSLTFHLYNIVNLYNTHTASLEFAAALHDMNHAKNQQTLKATINKHIPIIRRESSKARHLQALYNNKKYKPAIAQITQTIKNIEEIADTSHYDERVIESLINENQKLRDSAIALQDSHIQAEENLAERILSDRQDHLTWLMIFTGFFLMVGIFLTLRVVRQITAIMSELTSSKTLLTKSQEEILAREQRILNQYHEMKALSERLKEHGEEISQKNLLLEKANQLKTEFLANMSHELRTPLNAVIGFSEILRDQIQGELNEVQTDFTNEIHDSARHLLSLINDILDLSKIEAGKMDLFLEPVDLSGLLANSLSVVQEQAYAKSINLELIVNEKLDSTLADSRKLKQIIFNLLSNAVKFTDEHGKVSVAAMRTGNNFHFEISDTGIGISKEKFDMIFNPFEQIDGTLARHYEGTGLGLAMVKRLVELHGGKVRLRSVPGKGSCFAFTIPYKKPQEMDSSIINSQKIDLPTQRLTPAVAAMC